MSFLNLLLTPPPAGADGTQTGGPSWTFLIGIVLMIAVFYFFLIRPQKKQEKEAKQMLENLKKGDKIVTIGGIHGTVFAIKEGTVVVKVDDGAKIEFTKTAIAKVVNDTPAAEEKPAKAEKKAKAEKAVEEPAAEKPAKKAAKTSKKAK